MRINSNIASMNAQAINSNTNKEIGSSLEKLASGHSINKAADDSAGLAIADKLRTQASSLNQGIKNANSGVAMIQMADKAMDEQSNILSTVKTKLIQSATDTTTDDGRNSLKNDIKKLLTQFDNIATQTNYNGINLLNNDKTFTFQVGENAGEDISATTTRASNTANLGATANSTEGDATIAGADVTSIGYGESSTVTASGSSPITLQYHSDAANGSGAAFSAGDNQDIHISGNVTSLGAKQIEASSSAAVTSIEYGEKSTITGNSSNSAIEIQYRTSAANSSGAAFSAGDNQDIHISGNVTKLESTASTGTITMKANDAATVEILDALKDNGLITTSGAQTSMADTVYEFASTTATDTLNFGDDAPIDIDIISNDSEKALKVTAQAGKTIEVEANENTASDSLLHLSDNKEANPITPMTITMEANDAETMATMDALVENNDKLTATGNAGDTNRVYTFAASSAGDTLDFEKDTPVNLDITSNTLAEGINISAQDGKAITIDAAKVDSSAILGLTGASEAIQGGELISNIDAGQSKSITGGSQNITIKGLDSATGSAESITDTDIEGTISQLKSGTATATTFTANDAATIAIMDAAAANSSNLTATGNAGDADRVYTLTANTAVDFDNADININIKSSATTGIEINANEESVKVTQNKNDQTLGIDNALDGISGGGSNSLSKLKDLDTLTIDDANNFMKSIDTALTQLNENRSELGSTQVQLESAVRNQQVTVVSLNQAESIIRDTDYAAESANFNKLKIVSQAGMYAISQANAVQQNVQKLLQ